MSDWLDASLPQQGPSLNFGGSSNPFGGSTAPPDTNNNSSGGGSSFNETFATITSGASNVLNAFGNVFGGLIGANKTTASGMPIPPSSGGGGTPPSGMTTTTKILIGVVATLTAIAIGILAFRKKAKA